MVGRICPLGWNRAKVSENLCGIADAPVPAWTFPKQKRLYVGYTGLSLCYAQGRQQLTVY